MNVTLRDSELILDVYKYRYLSVSQVAKLHFPSRQTAYRRLRALTTLGFLKSFTVPNIPERVYFIDKPGAELVAEVLHVPIDELQWHRFMKAPKDYYFLRHFLAINDFRIDLTQACLDSPITLLGFIPDYVGEKVSGNVKKYIRDKVCDITNQAQEYSHTPDGVFALEKDGSSALFFLEIDRGTEILSDPEKGFLKAIVFYLNYRAGGQWKRYTTEFNREFKSTRTLIVTTSNERLQNMREVVTNFPFPRGNAKRFIWGTAGLTRERMFDEVWQVMDTADENSYRIG